MIRFDLREENWDFLNRNWPGDPELWNRDGGIGRSGGRTPSQILADQLTLSQPGGIIPFCSPQIFRPSAIPVTNVRALSFYVIRCPKY